MAASAASGAGPPPIDRRSLGAAVAALYTSPDAAERAAADAWLQAFMKSDMAWPLSLALLRDAVDLTPLEALFCARALHVLLRKSVSKTERTQKSHAVLAESDWIGMRDALLALAWTFSARVAMGATGADDAPPRAVLTQVALAVSVLACKMESWDAPGVAVDLARFFSRPPDAAPPSVLALVASRGGGVVAPPDASGAAGPAGPAGPVQGHVQLTPDGAAVVSVAGIVALLQIFAVLPEECASKDLSIHPARREAVSLGLRAAASSVVYPTLETLVHNPNVHADPHARALLMRALAAWSSFEPAAAGACPSSTLAAAVSAITVDARASHPAVADAAAAATTAAATAAVHRPERREALGATLAALREHCAGAGAGGDGDGRGGEDADDDDAESRARAAEVLASVATRAAEPPPPATPPPADPLAVGPNAAGDRTYIPYGEFKKMKKERRRGRGGGGGGGGADDARAAAPPLAEADVDALRFCLDALSDGLDAGGVSPAAALEPWTAMAAAVESHVSSTSGSSGNGNAGQASFGAFLLECGTRAAGAAARRASRVLPASGSAANDGARREDGGDDEDDAVDREDLAEGLRDVAAVVGADVFVAVVVDGAVTAARDAIAAATDANADGNAMRNGTPSTDDSLLRVAEGWIFALFAVARLTTTSPAAAATAARAVDLARGVMDARLSSRASELATWIIAGLARALSSPRSDAETLSSAVAAVAAGLESNDHAVARGACVAAMRLCETCGPALASDDPRAVRTRAVFAGWYARGGPAAPPPSALRRGQEPVTTILARGLAAVAKSRHPAGDAERECVALADPAIDATRRAAAATRDAAERAAATDADPSASPEARRRSLVAVADAALALRVAVVETHALVSACVASAERAHADGDPTAGDATDDATATRTVAAAAEALHAATTAAPALRAAGLTGSGDATGNRTGARKNAKAKVAANSHGGLRGAEDVVEAVASLLETLATRASASPRLRAETTLAPALAVAVDAFRRDPTLCHATLSVIVAALRTASACGHRARVAVAGEAAFASFAASMSSSSSSSSTRDWLERSSDAAVAATFALAQSALRAGAPAFAPAAETLAHVALESLRAGASGETALASLALASDALAASAMLAPAKYAANRTDAHLAAATTVHPGMGRLASNMSSKSGRGAHLPGWAANAEGAEALADAFASVFRGGGAAAATVRALLECANGGMPPNLVTDVSAAMFAAWASNGDEAFSGWLMAALGGDGDGFPRRGTTAAAKADFRDSLLMVNGACGGVDAQGRKMEAGAIAKGIKEGVVFTKLDLRRFKRVVKAFCGGKKANA